MNKAELISVMADKADMSKKDTEKVLVAFIDTVTEALKDGDKVSLVGFGTFEARNRAARTGINPRTKEKMTILATKTPSFKAGKAFKEVLKVQ
jgi:DNA-binding protein HU-beta